ncbi:hypothetical protein N5P37_009870, partial [Trichoderma harzianum]
TSLFGYRWNRCSEASGWTKGKKARFEDFTSQLRPHPPSSLNRFLARPPQYRHHVLVRRRPLQEVPGSFPPGYCLWRQLCPERHDGLRRVEERPSQPQRQGGPQGSLNRIKRKKWIAKEVGGGRDIYSDGSRACSARVSLHCIIDSHSGLNRPL